MIHGPTADYALAQTLSQRVLMTSYVTIQYDSIVQYTCAGV